MTEAEGENAESTRHSAFNAPWYGLPPGAACCTSLRVFANSSLELYENEVLQGGQPIATRRPSFSFLVRSGTGQFALFDLGVPGNWLDLVDDPDGYQKEFKTVVAVELVDLLKSEGVDPAKVETVIISHQHWDHTGNPASFPTATVLVGSTEIERIPVLKAYPPHLLRPIDWNSLPSLPIASFETSLDIFGDGSFLVVSTPGHTPTHLSALVRTSPNEYVLLASDCCHHTKFISNAPEHAGCEFAIFGEGNSYHENLAEAGRSLERIRACGRRENIFVVIAHDEKLWEKWGGGTVGPELEDWKGKGWKS